ncbi:methylmalonyl Co-A mutase-associated GTPase MeaB [Bacillus sp. EB600]|uniref:methylmalonyl Co-A mutase-associated GTPase MeaB n=1 Tax=Bacillus sp. EB600 TaxID=2806345 RepID=UPI002108B8E9|nr:methylmalonyl Co-A mutase-associated GTPase MeaB [Bacillus sp. EB600]MCQ6280888.1 methylmalonyl Co-A mutase-associated GTPase MeaB [Bacillus sp. EB600]
MMDKNEKKPEWVPEGGGSEFASRVLEGVTGEHSELPDCLNRSAPPSPPKRRRLSISDYVQGVLSKNRTIIAQTITLVESNNAKHLETAQEVLKQLLPYTGNSIRIGITGVPGAGKSTLIEALGTMLCEQGNCVAVLAVDPSSTVTGGSILGDKTRMDMLSRNPNAFIRPSASGGTLGGVNRKSRETMLICEAAGFDVIIVETVGVGQSEVTVRSMVDFFLLVMLTGGGDELQGIKKGVMELADAILVNKADGENKQRALTAKAEFNRILHYLQPITEGWFPQAYTCSALTGEGIAEMWQVIQDFRSKTSESGMFSQRRRKQTIDWMYTMVEDYLRTSFFNHPEVSRFIPVIEKALVNGEMSATMGAHQLLKTFEDIRTI